MTKKRKVRMRRKARRRRKRGGSGEEVGSRGGRENKQKTECLGGRGGDRGKEGGRLWLCALEVFNCLH